MLADQQVRLMKGKLRLRQVTRRMENGHQTPILTSRSDLPAAQVAFRMFERWRQENFFKYLCEEYALDALAEYAVVPDDPTREVPNPVWAAVDAEFRQAQAHLDRPQAESALLKIVASHYWRVNDEGRTLIQSALASAADIEVTDRELRVTLAPLSSAHRTRAIAALCEELNRTETVFPGSQLRLRYAVREGS